MMNAQRRFVLVAALTFVLCAAAGITAWGQDTTSPAPATRAIVSADNLAATGLEHALTGRFELAYSDFKDAAKADSNVRLQAAMKLLEGYQSVNTQSEQERAAEYAAAVEDVKRCMFVQSYLPTLQASGTEKKLHAIVLGASIATSQPASMPATNASEAKTLAAAYNRAGISEALAGASEAAEAGKIQANTVKALDETQSCLAQAVALLKADNSDYAKMFRELALKLDKQLSAYTAIWKNVDVDDAKARTAAAKKLRALEDDLNDAVADVETMVTEKPWQMGLAQGRLAMQLTNRSGKDKLVQEAWYRDLVAQVEAMAKKFVANSEWYDALNAYSGLQELAPDVEAYKEAAKVVTRHVHVLHLYGQKPIPQDQSDTAIDEPVASWKELVKGVDMEMVRSVIDQLDQNYVTAPDYKKLSKAALTAIRVLAETPQASNTFASLGDKDKREKFVQEINELSDSVAKKDRMDQMDLQILLNNVRDASERTVALPPAVLAVEFTDGFLEELDKFSNVIWPYELSEFSKGITGKFGGVGIQIGKERNAPLKVMSPLKDSPAYKAGIKSGDFILAVDGTKTDGMEVDALVKRITGPEGTKVVLTVKSPDMEPRDVELTRQVISIETVKGWQQTNGGAWDYMIDPLAGIGYVRLTQFTDSTIDELKSALESIKKKGGHSVVLDLRFNPGGLLRSAGDVASQFKNEGRVVSTKGRQSGESEIDAKPNGTFLQGDVMVLVNQYSASAAEIVSGALKDWKRAIVVGQRSYGKGSVQNVVYVSKRKAVLKVTNAYYYLPNGRCLHRKNGDKEWGVDPDVEVMLTPRQTRRWLDLRRKTDVLMDTIVPAQQAKDMAEQRASDLQLNTAVLLLQLMQLQEKNDQPGVATQENAPTANADEMQSAVTD